MLYIGKKMICPPEFEIYKPALSNRFKWVVEIIDPPTQGVYSTFTVDVGTSKETLRTRIESEMTRVYAKVGLDY
jgi:hypothetical protein